METRLSELTAQTLDLQYARALTRWTFAKAAAVTSADGLSALDIVRPQVGPRSSAFERLEKAATSAIMTSDTGLTSLAPLQSAWADLVRRQSLLGRMAGLRQVPALTKITAVDIGVSAAFVSEGAPIPVVRPLLTDGSLQPGKVAIIVPFTKEIASATNDRIVALAERDMARATARGEDGALLDSAAAVAGGRPASILNGLSALGGGSPSNVEEDVLALLAQVRGGDAVAPHFITSPAGARYLLASRDSASDERLYPNVTVNGGDIYGVPLLVSTGSPNILALVDADGVEVADAGVELDIAQAASFQFDTTPVNGAATGVSLFQSNAIAVRIQRWIAWRLVWANAAAFISLPV